MKKVLFIMAAALLMMTQCRKENATPNMPADGTVKMTITAGPGRTDINATTGAITWSTGDKLYVSDGINWLGSLTLKDGAGTPQGTFTGSIAGIDETETTCHFFYLGHDNGMEEPTGTAAANISLASQDGTLAGAMKYHAGYGTTDVTVESGEYQGYVVMNTKIAIAHFNFTADGTAAYKGSVTMGGTGIFNTLSVTPNGIFTGSGATGITIGNGGGTTGERYVTLIPSESPIVCVAFTGAATGSMTFLAGIRENKFYGMSEAIEVTVKPIEFSVGTGKVKFSPGNLYWDGSSWNFEANQYDFRTYNDGTEQGGSCINGVYSQSSGTPTGHWGLFGWSGSDQTHYGKNTSTSSSDYSGESLKDWGENAIGTDAADTWRTLTNDEWKYLLNTSNASSGARTDANRFAKARVSGVAGLLIFPDGYNVGAAIDAITGVAALNTTDAAYPTESIPDATWTSMESHGVVFLPAAGYRNGAVVSNVGSLGYYWSSSPGGSGRAYGMYFNSSDVYTDYYSRYDGGSVRLVRSAS